MDYPEQLRPYVDEQMAPVRGVRIRQSFRVEHRGFQIARNPERVPIVINNFNRLEYLRATVKALRGRGYENLYVIDNASTYEPLLDYYRDSGLNVFYAEENVGYLALWKTSIQKHFVGNHYVYTDSDIELAPECPADIVAYLNWVLDNAPHAAKVGPGLRIDDLPATYALRDEVVAHERQFQASPIAPGIFSAAIDTTFALYRPGVMGGWWLPSIRTGEPYVARHLPWYADSANPSAEEINYRATVSAVTHWTKTEDMLAKEWGTGPRLHEHFDHAYCINLARRADRWEEANRQFEAMGLHVERFEAVDGSTLDGLPATVTLAQSQAAIPGVVGCSLSHRLVLEDARCRGFQRVLILEDDVEFVPDADELFAGYINQVPDDWTMLYFGGNHQGGLEMVTRNVARIGGTYTTNAYAVTADTIERLLQVLPARPQDVKVPVDVFYASIHAQEPCYVFRPHLAFQRDGYSDVEQAHVDYGFLRD